MISINDNSLNMLVLSMLLYTILVLPALVLLLSAYAESSGSSNVPHITTTHGRTGHTTFTCEGHEGQQLIRGVQWYRDRMPVTNGVNVSEAAITGDRVKFSGTEDITLEGNWTCSDRGSRQSSPMTYFGE